ncbi:MAG: hypothetical protein R3Y28_03840 [Candidatus Gastranaerophilales bacterium]
MNIKTISKFIDQPLLINNLQQTMPSLLVGSGGVLLATKSHKYNQKEKKINAKKEEEMKNDIFISTTFPKKEGHKFSAKTETTKDLIIISSTIASSLISARGLKVGGKKIFNGLLEKSSRKEIIANQTKHVNQFLEKNIIPEDLKNILIKSKDNVLNLKEFDKLHTELTNTKNGKELIEKLQPMPKSLSSKEIFSEIKRLSILGAVPVLGGMSGGIVADKITHTETKHSSANKIKEGFYQYFANIFSCNIGAALALTTAEQLEKRNIIKPLSSTARLGVISTGIITTGVIGGSYIANYLGKNIINPIFSQKNKSHHIYSERKPEALDIALHVDDIATAGVMSGFKWVEPALPALYFISGYRAGKGYRNNLSENCPEKKGYCL